MITVSLMKPIQAIIETISANQTFGKKYHTVKKNCRIRSSVNYTLREKIKMGAYLEVLGTGYGVKIPKLSLKTKTDKSSLLSKTSPENALHAISASCSVFEV